MSIPPRARWIRQQLLYDWSFRTDVTHERAYIRRLHFTTSSSFFFFFVVVVLSSVFSYHVARAYRETFGSLLGHSSNIQICRKKCCWIKKFLELLQSYVGVTYK